MMRRLRDSGIKWIGEIPENWRIESIGRHFENRNEKVSDYDYAPLSVTKSGVVPQLDEVAKSNAHEDRKLVRRGDFVINSRSDRKQSCGLSAYDGSVSLINLVLVPHGEIDSSYSSYLFNNYGFAEEFYRWGTGIVADLWSTKWDLMRRINVPVPPHAEQKKIADFLDGKCAEIDELVQTEEKMIEELKAYKQSVITEAVTKGLDPTVPMKDSGIEWIGKIPEKWGVVLLSSLFSHHKSKNVGLQETNLLSLSYGRIVRKDITTSEGLLPESFETYNIVDVDDIVFRLTDLQNDKRSLRTGHCKEKGIITSAYTVIRPTTSSTDSRYLQYLYHAYDICKVFYGLGDGVRQGMGFDDLKKIPTLVPSLDEQKQIADYLDEKCTKIDEIIALHTEQINQLKEYKKSLIYEYVTGKKEVV